MGLYARPRSLSRARTLATSAAVAAEVRPHWIRWYTPEKYGRTRSSGVLSTIAGVMHFVGQSASASFRNVP